MLIAGIDIGTNGALALIDDKSNVIRLNPFLINTVVEYDLLYITKIINNVCDDHIGECILFCMEDVRNIQGSGSSANFNFGKKYGEIDGILSMIELVKEKVRIERVSPRKWQKKIWVESDKVFSNMGKIDTKKTSLNAFNRIFPGVDARQNNNCSVPHDGIVDAALIAEAARVLYPFK